MRRVEHLIRHVRRATQNERVAEVSGSEEGISDEVFIQYLNDGQERIASLIRNTHQKAFTKEAFVSTVYNQELYDLPFDIETSHNIMGVDYSRTGNAEDYLPLEKIKLIERRSFRGYPEFYCPRSTKVLINPIPDTSVTNGLRINYNPRFPKLDKRRGVISSVTLDTGARTITSLVLDPESDIFNADVFSETDYLCIVDRDGVIKMRAIPISAVDTTGVVTVVASYVYPEGSTAAAGDYVVMGDYATTHSQLPDICEKYLLAYDTWKILKDDSSNDSSEQKDELAVLAGDIVESFAEVSGDVDQIPIINEENVW